MIYFIDPIRTLVASNEKASLDFLCPHLTEQFNPVLNGKVLGHAEVSDAETTIRIFGKCIEGQISVEASDSSYISAIKKARSEFARIMDLWMEDRYGRVQAKEKSSVMLLERTHLEAERFQLLSPSRLVLPP